MRVLPFRSSRPIAVIGVLLGLPIAARGATLSIDDTLISIDECLDRANQTVSLSWDLSGSSGSSMEILASNTSGCSTSSSSVTTAVLVDGLSTGRTSYPESGESSITLDSVLAAAGKSDPSCEGSDFRVYMCVKLLDGSGSEVATASSSIKFQLARPPPPIDVSVSPGEKALWVSWSAGSATTSAPASSKTYRAYASAEGATYASSETSSTTVRVGGLENGTTYDVWVVAYSEAGNESARSELSAGTPQHVLGFYELYQSSGGRESGGCSHGDTAWLSMVAVLLIASLWLVRARSARRPRPPREER